MKNQNADVRSGAKFQSSVGSVVDVATPSKRRLRALGLVWALVTLFPFVIINYLVIEFLTSSDSILRGGNPMHLLGAALMPLMGWFALGSAIQRFHAASLEGRYFRSGPGGISVSFPDDNLKGTFRFSFRLCTFDLAWDQIKTWYPYVQSMNGIPTERSIVFETLKGEKIKIKTYHFAEKQKQIMENLARARSMRLKVDEQTLVTPAKQQTKQQDAKDQQPGLPPGAGELSIQIKKKKDPVKEVDLRTIPFSERAACIERIADSLEAKMASLCPVEAGFKYSRKSYRPFKEWKNIFGIRIFVRRGLFDGNEIQLEPNDSECRRLTVSMCHSSLISDIRKYVSIAIGVVFVLKSFKWLPVIAYWLGDFSRLTPIVMLAIFVAALALSAGLLQLPISLLRLLISNKQNEEAQKQRIRVGIREMAI
jgi:hypothetical protein